MGIDLRLLSAVAICGLLIGAPGGAAFAYPGQQLTPGAKLSLEQARTIALKAAPGKITKLELEEEAGGSGLRYSFVIKRRGKAYEVGVDAQTGAILENKAEGPNPD